MSRIGDRAAVVPREKPPHPYSPVGGFMFLIESPFFFILNYVDLASIVVWRWMFSCGIIFAAF